MKRDIEEPTYKAPVCGMRLSHKAAAEELENERHLGGGE
jgi:hypothetical protein